MKTSTRVRDLPIFATIEDILKHYECPSDCDAFCCRIQPVDMDSTDRKILRKASKEKTDGLETHYEDGRKYYRLEYPCPFLLESGKCSAYDRRPTVCRMYPFNFDENVMGFRIYPCKVGVAVCYDLFEYSDKVKGKKAPDEVIERLESSCELFYSDVKIDDEIPMIGLPATEVEEFGKYLNSKYP